MTDLPDFMRNWLLIITHIRNIINITEISQIIWFNNLYHQATRFKARVDQWGALQAQSPESFHSVNLDSRLVTDVLYHISIRSVSWKAVVLLPFLQIILSWVLQPLQLPFPSRTLIPPCSFLLSRTLSTIGINAGLQVRPFLQGPTDLVLIN